MIHGARATGAATLALLAIGVCSCDRQPGAGTPGAGTGSAVPFVERAAEVGLDFVHFNGMSGGFHFVELMGSGVALTDLDNDGDLDVYLVQGAMIDRTKTLEEAIYPPADRPPQDRLYRNELVETGSLRFTDVTVSSGIEATGYGMGVAVGDYDRDGYVDLYVTNWGSNQMLHNEGDGTFRDVVDETGTGDDRWSTSAAFVDYDHDGWLDLFVTNYVDYTLRSHKDCFSGTSELAYCSPKSYRPYPDRLFRNRGDGTFEDVTASAGIAQHYGSGLGIVCADFNGDRLVDLYVANDGNPNQLWINSGEGRFEDVAVLAGAAYNEDGLAEAGMGVDAADFDGDGDEDLFMTHIDQQTNTLYVNDGSGWFEDGTLETDLGSASMAFTGFGTAWIDFDNDGWLDLIIANGAVLTIEALRLAGDPYALAQRNQIFRNLGDGRFEEITDRAGAVFELVEVGRGAAFGDVDNDGDTDVLLNNNSGPARLLINEIGNRNHWLGLRLRDEQDVYDLPGTHVEVIRADGTSLWRRVRVAGSYESANDPRVLVGLDGVDGVREVRTYWPGRPAETWEIDEVDRYLTLRRGTGRETR